MKKFIIAMISVLITMLSTGGVFANHRENMRGAWIATVYNLDFPTAKNNAEAQKKEFSDKLDKLQEMGINTVIVQVRPKSDALYQSKINPWSDVLTGIQGQYPGYDPLAYMVEEAHKRNMDFHAWLNPYRVTTSGTDINSLCETHPARLHPQWLIEYNGALYYNPALDEVKEYIADTVKEIAENYDVDAIHYDDYFYPSDYPLTEGATPDSAEADARRQHVNDMIRMSSQAIKSVQPDCMFGVSPMGIWKNASTDPMGSNTNGKEAYYSVFADTLTWIKEGWIDYVVPQIYWEIGNKAADYETLVKWWSDQVKGTKVHLYIGEAVYKDEVSSEIKEHLKICEKDASVQGNIFYSAKELLANRQQVAEQLKEFYRNPVEDKNDQNENSVSPSPLENQISAIFNSASIYINDQKVLLESYNINGYNYFKLRDIAATMTETGSRFDVLWDEDLQKIKLITGQPYTVLGGELAKGDGKNKNAVKTSSELEINGTEFKAEAYNISGNNYFKLRDLGNALDFSVVWDQQAQAIKIYTLNLPE
ncbi:MAG: family 10 glycosylhydrolase [Clostridiales bacterium]|nr:family 10 glycosylhydrolase [Clostridiales bacterium]